MVVAIKAHRIAYMPVPKAACSSVKSALALLDPDVSADGDAFAQDEEKMHEIYPTMRFRPHRWEAYEDWWRFTVIRDPLKRLLAVWTDRVQDRRELFNSPRLRRQTRLPPDPDPDFFFQNLKEYAALSSAVKHHALAVCLFVGPKPLRYDRVFRIADLPDLAGELGRITRREVTIPRFNRSSVRLNPDDLAGKTRDALAAHLAEDYAHLCEYYDNPFA